MSELGDYLRNARNEKGLSQAKVQTQIGITNSRLCKAENGADNILSAAELKKLAVLYGVPVVPLFIMAGFLETSDLEEYRSGFKNTSMLDSDEKNHIQDQIDFIIKKKGSKEQVRKQIGMAVPCEGAKIIFEAILKTFAGEEYEYTEPNIKDED